MKELVRANDLALISFIEALLTEAGVRYFVADAHASAVDGSISALPRRILVDAEQETEARRLLADAGLGGELRLARP
ncbi:MAG: DUF2007 domain-containing protein [Parvularculaceae bacterium]|nr:DUF2007 domain-containing protein [Parvularculaceae bacterium]